MLPTRQIRVIISLVTVACFGAFSFSVWSHFQSDRKSIQFVGTWDPNFYTSTPPKTKLEIRADNTFTFEHETHSRHLAEDKIILEKYYAGHDIELGLPDLNHLTDNTNDGANFTRL